MKTPSIKYVLAIIPTDLKGASLLRIRMLAYTLFEISTRKFFVYYTDEQGSFTKIPTPLLHRYAKIIPRLWAYLNIISYDEPVESLNLKKSQIYNQLIRCALGLYVGRSGKYKLSYQEFDLIIKKLKDDVRCVFGESHEYREMVGNINHVVISLYKETSLAYDGFIISDFLFKPVSASELSKLNYSIIASYGYGWELGQLESFIEKYISPYNEDFEWTKKYISEAFIKAGYSQANTPSQTEIENINWKKYVKIACGKSTYFVDLANCSRSLLSKYSFYQSRLGRGRFCEQFYIDDIRDFRKDNSQGILNFLHIFLLEQGRLAEALTPYLSNISNLSDKQFEQVNKLISTSYL
ncbi:MAG: hypothetical protein H6657_09165 [Ardenticatenaceae bacterium]|nr:hypothetical protein [Ardenticatenaceae bacterium]